MFDEFTGTTSSDRINLRIPGVLKLPKKLLGEIAGGSVWIWRDEIDRKNRGDRMIKNRVNKNEAHIENNSRTTRLLASPKKVMNGSFFISLPKKGYEQENNDTANC